MCWVIFAQQESCSCDELHSKLAVKSRTSYLTQPTSFIKTYTKEPKSHLHTPCAFLQYASRTKMKDQKARASVDPTASTSLPDTVKGKITRWLTEMRSWPLSGVSSFPYCPWSAPLSSQSAVCSNQNGAVSLFAASCVQSCRGWNNHLPGCWGGGARHPQGGGWEGCGRDGWEGGRGEVQKRGRKRERERGRASSNALQRQGGNTTGEERRQTAALRLGLALTRTCARTCSSLLIDRYRAPSSGWRVVGRCWESKSRIKNHLLRQVYHSVETSSIKRPLFPRLLCPTISDHMYAQNQLLS